MLKWMKEYIDELMNKESKKSVDGVRIVNQEVQLISKDEVRDAMKRM